MKYSIFAKGNTLWSGTWGRRWSCWSPQSGLDGSGWEVFPCWSRTWPGWTVGSPPPCWTSAGEEYKKMSPSRIFLRMINVVRWIANPDLDTTKMNHQSLRRCNQKQLGRGNWGIYKFPSTLFVGSSSECRGMSCQALIRSPSPWALALRRKNWNLYFVSSLKCLVTSLKYREKFPSGSNFWPRCSVTYFTRKLHQV